MTLEKEIEKLEEKKLAIRFGLGAIKAVGFGMMEKSSKERRKNGKFKDIYDFAERMDPRSINKKSIEALAKAGAFDSLQKNRRQIAESFEILSAYANEKHNEANSNQMSLFGGLAEAEKKPELKKTSDWNKNERLQKEFEAFGFFLSEHPVDDYLDALKKRGVVFSDKLERDEFEDGDAIKMAGVIASSKHRSGSRGRFAYLTISDPYGIFEVMIFDEALITSARDILADGSQIAIDCLVRKDDGGTRISVRDVKKLDDFIGLTKARDQPFEDIQKQIRRNFGNRSSNRDNKDYSNFPQKKKLEEPAKITTAAINSSIIPTKPTKNAFTKVEIIIKEREPIFAIKALLSQSKIFDLNEEKITKVFFTVIQNGKITKIELNNNYSLDRNDVNKLRQIPKIIDVEAL